MHLTSPLLIYKLIIICNILTFAAAKVTEVGGAPAAVVAPATASQQNEPSNEDKLKFNNITPIKPTSAHYTTTTATPTTPTTTSLTATTTTTTTSTITSRPATKVCPGLHIRNDLKSFEQLRGCTIINGALTIALVENKTQPFEAKHYENITFPELIEITDYLLFFRVEGLITLSSLFPSLSLIRGRELVSNYALIIYEMKHLQNIHLPQLSDILRGSIRIQNNPDLCYVSTVNWEGIAKHIYTPHFIMNNNPRCNNLCPGYCRNENTTKFEQHEKRVMGDVERFGSGNDTNAFCWTNQHCHFMCQVDGMRLDKAHDDSCCSPQCAGGCYQGNRADQCKSCRFVSQGDKCVEQCDRNSYEYKGRCLNEAECTSMIETVLQQNQCKSIEVTSNLKAVRLPFERHGRCQVTCPPGYEEDATNKNKCKPCDKGKCRKVCTPKSSKGTYMVTSVSSLRELSGCNVINGSLEISLKGGKNVMHELETAFHDLEEIKGFLKITRSAPIITLGFFSKLKAINGSELERDASLLIIDNPNLQELFMFNRSNSDEKRLHILRGKIFAHLNPKLCPHIIDNLLNYSTIAEWSEEDVSRHTNGDREACDTKKMEVKFLFGTARGAMISFENVAARFPDPRQVLYYLINYREALNGNVTMFDGRDGCNSQNDVWMTIEETPVPVSIKDHNETNYQSIGIQLKPATRYALFVKTFTIRGGSTGALSDIIYFETAPDTPGHPREVTGKALNPSSVAITWLPPSKPNGIIVRYKITIKTDQDKVDLKNINFCDSTQRGSYAQKITVKEPTKHSLIPTRSGLINETSSNDGINQQTSTCAKSTPDVDADLQAEVVTFQDMVIEIVYIKQTCLPTSNRTVKKRSTELLMNDLSSSRYISEPKNLPQTLFDEPPIKPKVTNLSKNQTNTPLYINYNASMTEITVNVTVSPEKLSNIQFDAIITGLDHFTHYTIEIQACHDDQIRPEKRLSSTYQVCGITSNTFVRTDPIPEFDKVPSETITFNPANDTSSDNIITWKPPERPNGPVLAYNVHYKLKNSHSLGETISCVNLTSYNFYGGFIFSELNPGIYTLQVETISMYSSGALSEPFEFEILPNYLVSPTVFWLLIISGIISLVVVVAMGTYYYQKRQHAHFDRVNYASVNPEYVEYNPDEWEVDQKNLIVGKQIGTGSFGMVFSGQLTTEKGSLKCAIKTVPSSATTKQRIDFLREASIMKQFDTFHVVKLMGVVSTTNPVYVIMEYMENGDLKSFLRSIREVHLKENKPLVEGIYLMAAQIADGMAYLVSKKFVHRDLAARNCMVGENRIVKIGDFGLTRDIYVNDYYRRGTTERLPVRWMAPESLKDNIYTSASDAWSYGIVVWEMVTFSAYPYQGKSNEEVIKQVIRGDHMDRPTNCPDKLFQIMEKCWRKNDRDRPSFNEIVEYLLPETEGKLYPNCFFRKQKTDGDSIPTQPPSNEDNHVGAESYALLSWPNSVNRTNGLTNGVNHDI